MTNAFLNGLIDNTNYAYTENGAVAHATTKSALVDLFAQMGALRSRSVRDIEKMVSNSFNEFPLETLKLVFHLRNIRGGLGERKVGRIALEYLAQIYPKIILKNLDAIALFGRWDDFFCLLDTQISTEVFEYIKEQFVSDLQNYSYGDKTKISLLAKWMPSENASAKSTKLLAKRFIDYLEISPKIYRTSLSKLRKHLSLVENNLREKDYSGIRYESIPARAMLKYRKAFFKNDEEAFRLFLDDVTSGKKTIKAGDNIFPTDLVKKCLKNTSDGVVDAQWNALPDYIGDAEVNSIVVADVSGSMFCNDDWPIASSIALAIYCAEKMKGPYAGHFITFSQSPQLIKVRGNTLAEKVRSIEDGMGYNTNVEAVFDLMLTTAIDNKLEQNQIPNQIIIVSDMQFDAANGSYGKNRHTLSSTLFKMIATKWNDAGYQLPQLVYWNVNATSEVFPMTKKDNVLFVSGYSPRIFEGILKGQELSPLDLIYDVINKPMYEIITL